MQLNTLTRTHTRKRTVRIGRGHTRGKTSGRGHKGQKSRAGHHIRPAIRDVIKRIPKLRGHGKNRSRTVNNRRVKPEVVTFEALNVFENGTRVTPSLLIDNKLVRRHGGRTPEVKVLARGTLNKKLTIIGCTMSEKARDGIAHAGGTVV